MCSIQFELEFVGPMDCSVRFDCPRLLDLLPFRVRHSSQRTPKRMTDSLKAVSLLADAAVPASRPTVAPGGPVVELPRDLRHTPHPSPTTLVTSLTSSRLKLQRPRTRLQTRVTMVPVTVIRATSEDNRPGSSFNRRRTPISRHEAVRRCMNLHQALRRRNEEMGLSGRNGDPGDVG
jgi:hypothetical protein